MTIQSPEADGQEPRLPSPEALAQFSWLGQKLLRNTAGAATEITPFGVMRTAHYDLTPDTVVSVGSARGDITMRVIAATWINKPLGTYRLDSFFACYAPVQQVRLYSARTEVHQDGQEIQPQDPMLTEPDDLLGQAMVDSRDLETKHDDRLSADRLEKFTAILQALTEYPEPSELLSTVELPAIISDAIGPADGVA